MKYINHKVAGHWLYCTSHCIIEPVHAHASDSDRLPEAGSAKLWVKENGDTIIADHGNVPPKAMNTIRAFIKENIETIISRWENFAGHTDFMGKGKPHV